MQSVQLEDGRRLTYSAAGPAGGFPVLYLHGAIGSPLRRSEQLDSVIEELRIRYLMVNRPGFGGSDPHPGRSVADFARDVRQLADALRLDRFGVAGVSAGGVYALACAREMPERLTAAAACSSLSPLCAPHATRGMSLRYRLPLVALARHPELGVRLGDAGVRFLQRHPGLLVRLMTSGAWEADRELLANPEARDTAARSFLASAGPGVEALVDDYVLSCRPWGFDPSEVRGRVHVWHGMRDRLVPVEHALQLASALPDCRLSLAPDEGHFFFRRRLREILGLLVGRDTALRAPASPV
jgi:pimeloyl-ACP methyl ester carboxylesterase